MTAFLKIDECQSCHRSLPWEWIPAVPLGGKTLAGTGVWRSLLTDGLCPACLLILEERRRKEERALAIRNDLIELLGGEKPYREFVFEKFQVTRGNRLAYERSKEFNPTTDNLYLWGTCGVGKTHLAYAIARYCFEQDRPVEILKAAHLSRKVRMKDLEEEQRVINGFARTDVLVLDDLGIGNDTAYGRQILQEILDARDFNDRGGLVITSKYGLSALTEKLNEDTIPSRLAGMCRVIEVKGVDHRLLLRARSYHE